MTDIASGTVTKLYVNTFDDGGKSISFRISGDNRYFRTGKNRFEGILEEGNTIKFKFAPVSEKAAKVIGTPKLGTSAPAAPAANRGAGAAPVDWAAKDANIQYQAARKDALSLAQLVLQHEAVKLPAAVAKRLEVIEALVDRYTAAFFSDVETKGAVARVTPAASPEPEVEEPEDSEPPADDDWD